MTNKNLPHERWRYLVEIGVWPKRANFDPIGWMSNFPAEESRLALRLLEGFTYFSTELVTQMFRSAFLNISQLIVTNKNSHVLAKNEWASFINSILVVRVTGEIPNDADSGFMFARLAREVLNISEAQIISPQQALEALSTGTAYNVLFVDDFVGSGNQFCETWMRQYNNQRYTFTSFKNVVATFPSVSHFYYCPVICTELGKNSISQYCPEVQIVPAHFYGSKHSALSSDSEIWREDMRTEGPEFVKTASERAQIPDLNGSVGCWQGFHKLGLALAFQHGWPDASLPLFYSTENNWKPLLIKGVV
jgi:hypothetical protein